MPKGGGKREHKVIDGMETALCTRCKEFIPITDFQKNIGMWDGIRPWCKKCCNLVECGGRHRPNKELQMIDGIDCKKCPSCNIFLPFTDFNRSIFNSDGFQTYCRTCMNALPKKRRNITSFSKEKQDEIRAKNREYYALNKNKKDAYLKNWRQQNAEKVKEYSIKTRSDPSNKQRAMERVKLRKISEPGYKMKLSIKSRMRFALKGEVKSDRTIELLGCSVEYYRDYIQNLFKPGMTFENYGSIWNIDHIIPCAAFDLSMSDEQKKCFHYTNTQPLFVEENASKGDKIPGIDLRGRYIKDCDAGERENIFSSIAQMMSV